MQWIALRQIWLQHSQNTAAVDPVAGTMPNILGDLVEVEEMERGLAVLQKLVAQVGEGDPCFLCFIMRYHKNPVFFLLAPQPFSDVHDVEPSLVGENLFVGNMRHAHNVELLSKLGGGRGSVVLLLLRLLCCCLLCCCCHFDDLLPIVKTSCNTQLQ